VTKQTDYLVLHIKLVTGGVCRCGKLSERARNRGGDFGRRQASGNLLRRLRSRLGSTAAQISAADCRDRGWRLGASGRWMVLLLLDSTLFDKSVSFSKKLMGQGGG
jgi:hypothetical protein